MDCRMRPPSSFFVDSALRSERTYMYVYGPYAAPGGVVVYASSAELCGF